jgi:hypothetical protein
MLIIMKKILLHIPLLLLPAVLTFGQEIRLEHKIKEGQSRILRIDKPVMARTFDGRKVKGLFTDIDRENLRIGEQSIPLEEIMMISGFVIPDGKSRTTGLVLSVGAGVVLPVAVYYILGGIAWAQPNGIFIGATILAFDLLLAYAGASLMGIYPRRFSTLNWEITPAGTDQGLPGMEEEIIPLPRPTG